MRQPDSKGIIKTRGTIVDLTRVIQKEEHSFSIHLEGWIEAEDTWCYHMGQYP